MSDKERKLNVAEIAAGLGGKLIGKVPTPKGGFFGALQTARDVADLKKRKKKPKGK